MESADGAEGKCELLLTWLSRLPDEHPQRNASYVDTRRAVYLYRDEDFRALFGRTFDQTTDKWRSEFHDDIVKRCQGYTKARFLIGPQRSLTEYARRLTPFRDVLDGPFLSQPGALSPQAVSRAITQARAARSWMDASLADVSAAASPSTQSFTAVQSLLAQSAAHLSVLWPSELRYFKDTMERRRREIASQLVGEWIDDLGDYIPNLEEARRLVEERRRHEPLLAVLDVAARLDTLSRADATLDKLIHRSLQASLDDLSKIPGSLDGAVSLPKWKSAFDKEFQPFSERGAVASARQTYVAKRQQVLEAAYPEWTRTLTENDPVALQTKGRRLIEVFPDANDKHLPSYAQYQALFQQRVAALQESLEQDRLRQLVASHRAGAERGDAKSSYQLHLSYAQGTGVPRDEGQAFQWLERAAEQGHAGARYELYQRYSAGTGVSKDLDKAGTWLTRAAEAGDARAQVLMGRVFEFKHNNSEALKWYQRAADQGDPSGIFSVGRSFSEGLGRPEDQAEANRWFLRAAELGLPIAQAVIAARYAGGIGTAKNQPEAIKWRLRAAQGGDSDSQHLVGLMYSAGYGLPANKEEAVVWMRRAVEQEHPGALQWLAFAYLRGEGVSRDVAEGDKLMRRASELGDPEAQFAIGIGYHHGQGVAVDLPEAFKWYRLAAEQGEFKAQANLGSMYRDAQATPRDYVRAHSWLSLSASRAGNHAEAFQRYADSLAQRMTAEQLEASARIVKEWKPKTWEELQKQPPR